jgi:drug/metabolite transporter (DMT)-like permease
MLPYILLTVAPLCWAGNVVLARGIVDRIPPVSLAFWRWSVAFMILLPFAFRQAKRDWKQVAANWKITLFLSLTGISLFNTLLYISVQTTTAINASLIQTAMPAVIILISLAAFKDNVTIIQLLGVCLCMAGAFLVVMRGNYANLTHFQFVKGDLIMFLAVFLYALYSAFLRKRPPIHPLSFLLFTMGIGSLGLSPIYLWERWHVGLFVLDQTTLASILYVSLFPSLVAYFCWNRGVELIGANRAGLFINLIPVFASLMAIVWLNESFELFHFIGLTMVITGMVLFNKTA